MTLAPYELENLRTIADKAAIEGEGETARLLTELLEAGELERQIEDACPENLTVQAFVEDAIKARKLLDDEDDLETALKHYQAIRHKFEPLSDDYKSIEDALERLEANLEQVQKIKDALGEGTLDAAITTLQNVAEVLK